MAIGGQSISSEDKLPAIERSFTQHLGRGIVGVLDAPGNFTRSILVGEGLNALKSITPFVDSERIPGSRVTGSTNFFLNLGAELVLDPLILVPGLGVVTKAGKTAKGISKARSLGAVFAAQGRAVEAAAQFDRAADLTKAFKQLRKVGGKKLTGAHLLTIGPTKKLSAKFGSDRGLKRAIRNSPIALLPNVKRLALESKITGLSTSKGFKEVALAEATDSDDIARITKQISDLDDKIETAQNLVTNMPIPIIPRTIGKVFDETSKKFGFAKRDPRIEALEDITKTDIASMTALLGKTKKVFLDEVEQLQKAQAMSQSEVLSRLVKVGEQRQFQSGGVLVREGESLGLGPASKVLLQKEVDKDFSVALSKEIKSRLDRIKIADKIEDPVKRATKLGKIEVDTAFNLQKIRETHSFDSKRFAEVRKHWVDKGSDFTPQEIGLANALFGDSENLLKLERQQRIAISPLEVKSLDYVRRLMTTDAKKLRRTNKKQYETILNDARVHLGAAAKRTMWPELEILQINLKLKQVTGIKFNFFSEDAIELALKRRSESYQAVSKAKAANAVVELYGKEGIEGVSAVEFLKKMGLSTDEMADVGLAAVNSKLKIPKDIVDQVSQFDTIAQKSILNSDNLEKFLKWTDDNINSAFRVGLTVGFPSFHHRNAVGNWFLNHLGGVSNPKFYQQANRAQKAIFEARSAGKVLSSDMLKLEAELSKFRITRIGQFEEFQQLTKGTTPRRLIEKVIDIDKPFSKVLGQNRRFTPGTGTAYGIYIEDNARIAHYLAKRNIEITKAGKVIRHGGGLDEFEAMRSVNKFLFDYGKATPFERKFVKPIFLFYTWTRNNVPLMVQTSLHNPRLMSSYVKLIQQGQGEVPDYLRTSSVIPNPFGKGFISDPGAPMAQLNMFNIDDVDPDNFAGMARFTDRLASLASPLPKLAYSVITGRDPFSGRPLQDIPFGTTVLRNLPTSRVTRTISQVLDTKKSVPGKLFDLFTGVRVYSFSKLKGERAVLQKKAIGTGKFRRLGGFLVIPKKDFTEDPQVKIFQRALRKIDREIKAEQAR